MKHLDILHPVVLAVPSDIAAGPPAARVKSLSRLARKALEISAQKSGVQLGELAKGADGGPLPSNGMHWSLSHKPNYVAAVVSKSPIGIDLELLKARKTVGLLDKVANPAEWRLVSDKSWHFFYRFWTAKEAVLKASVAGLKHLSMCRIEQIVDNISLVVRFMGRKWSIEHFYFDGHIASVVKDNLDIDWILTRYSLLGLTKFR